MHRAQAIIDAIQVRLENVAGLSVINSDASLNENFPVVKLMLGTETEQDFCPQHQVMELEVLLTIYVREKEQDDLRKQLLTMRERIHKQIMITKKLGKPYVQHLRFTNQSVPDFSLEHDTPTGSVELTLVVHYESPLNNPSEV